MCGGKAGLGEKGEEEVNIIAYNIYTKNSNQCSLS